jgi:tripartite-type tricarboxylate transporter receptor subunit TctC
MRKLWLIKLFTCFISGFILTSISISVVSANEYPEKTIKLYVGWAPGGSSDTAARQTAGIWQKYLNTPIVIVNLQGAGGTIAANQVAKSKADGYTLLQGSIGHETIAPALRPNLPYTLDDFQPIGQTVVFSNVLGVKPDIQASNLQEFISYIKTHPGEVKCGHPGVGTSPYMVTQVFLKEAGIRKAITLIPYKGAAGTKAGYMGDFISFSILNSSDMLPLADAGKLNALATTFKLPDYPKIPTFEEEGFPKSMISAWGGILAPAGIPDEVKTKLVSTLKQAMEDPVLHNLFLKIGGFAAYLGPEEFAAQMRNEYENFRAVAKEEGIGIEK